MPEDKIRSDVIKQDAVHVVSYVKCTASLACPLANEVFDANVLQCNTLRFFTFFGTSRMFFINHSVPEDMFNSHDDEMNAWINDDKEVQIT